MYILSSPQMRKVSAVWDDYEVVERDVLGKARRVKCRHCGEVRAANTTKMVGHVLRQHGQVVGYEEDSGDSSCGVSSGGPVEAAQAVGLIGDGASDDVSPGDSVSSASSQSRCLLK